MAAGCLHLALGVDVRLQLAACYFKFKYILELTYYIVRQPEQEEDF